MTPLYGFGDKAVRKKDYKSDCSLCGGNQNNWTTLSKTQKMVKALTCAMRGLIISDTPATSKEKAKHTAFVVKCNG